MATNYYTFLVGGYGDTPEQAWDSCMECLVQDGDIPDAQSCEEVED